ncbi:MAG TPA: hypothetical protein VH643_23930 [Gemmataceae bacterium]|jgi:hypothetical protein
MPYRLNCPICKTAYNVADDSLGKTLQCKKCQKPFAVGKAKPPAPVSAKPPLTCTPKAAAGPTTTDLPPCPPDPLRSRDAIQPETSSAAPSARRGKSALMLGGVVAAALLVVCSGIAGAIVAGVYFLKPDTKAPVAQGVDQSATPPNPMPPAAPDRTEQPASHRPDAAAEKSSPTTTPSDRANSPSSPTSPATPAVQVDPTRLKIPNPRLAKYEPDSKRWVYLFPNPVRATNGMFYIDVLPPGAPTDRDAYAAKLLQKDPMGAGPPLAEITEKGDLPDGFFVKGVTNAPSGSKKEPAFILVRKVNGAFLRCRNGIVAHRPVSDDELRQAMLEVFKKVTIRTTTLISLPPPSGAVMLRDNATLVVAHAETANLIYFDTMGEREVKRVEVDFQPGELIVQGDTLFSAAKGSAMLYALDAATGKVKKEYNLGGDGIVHIACHPRSGLIYASTTKFGVVSVDPASGAVNKTKALGQFLAVSPGGKFLYTGVQPPDRDEVEIIFRKDGSMRIYSDMWGPRAMLMKYAVDGPELHFVSGQNNAAVNGWWMHLTPDGKLLMMVGGGGWRPPREGGTGGGYVTAVFRTDNLQTMAQQIPFSGLNTIIHPVLNLGVANSYGMTLTLFNGKSLVKRASIELNQERESRPLLLMFGGKGRKLLLWNGDNRAKEQGLHFLPLPLKAEEEAALAKADEQPPAPEPDESAPPSTPR